jgi:DNA gyrase subunit A
MTTAQEGVRDLLIEQEMKDSYLNYAMSVIVSRALPDVRDGLKPSQRRILVAMNDLNLHPRAKFRKCAKICGDTSGNYHPHGEQVIYPTLVRMAQEFNMRFRLIEGQGNFGSIDPDPPAAMRYTEARMDVPAQEMMEDLALDTVDFVPNYDETREEPTVLPGKFPNLLCNGSSGIAVGMTTNIPPHNFAEVADAITMLIDEPDVELRDLMRAIQGPDLPTGGIICGRKGIIDAYKTGRGHLTVRSRVHVEEKKSGRKTLVVTEIPFQVSKTRIIEKIADVVKDGRIQGISDIRDESDRKDGVRLVIELKKDADADVVVNQLYKFTPLQESFGVVQIALVDNRPQLLDLKQLLEAYRNHRVVVIRRRTRFLLAKAEKRAHILEGLLIALDHIDEVVETIKASADGPTARAALVERFELSEEQAEAIVQMRLVRLTGLEQEKIREEHRKLLEEIARYKAILADEKLVLAIIKEDLVELKKRFGEARRTEIVATEVEDINVEDLIAEEDVVVTVSHDGYVKRMPVTTYRAQGRGGKGIIGAETKEGDFVEQLFVASTHDYLLAFTNHGQLHWIKVYDIPDLGRTSRGRAIVNVVPLRKDEKIESMVALRNFTEGALVMVTEQGKIKKTLVESFSRPRAAGIRAITLEEGDRLIGVKHVLPGQEVMLGTELGYAIRFEEKNLRPMGRSARGVRGISLRDGDRVRDLVVVDAEAEVLTLCENGYGKRTPFSEYRITNRGGKGIINIVTSERNGKVIGLVSVREEDEIIMISQEGKIVRTRVEEIRSTAGRASQGVRCIGLNENDRLVAIARVDSMNGEEEAGDGDATVAEGAEEVGSAGD